jgi:hypothetical protein
VVGMSARGMTAIAACGLGVAACGRVGFEPDRLVVDAGDEPGTDSRPAPPPQHQYDFDFTYTDDYGGPDAEPQGGDFDAGGYRFDANLGLKLRDVIPIDVYTIDLVFSFSQLGSWRKILDFKSLVTDEGLYTFDDRLQFVVVAGSTFAMSQPVWAADEPHQVTLTRDATGRVTGYVDRAFGFQFDDTARVAAIDDTGPWVYAFIDDTATAETEASAGVVRRIRIWDVALEPGQIPE